VIVRPTLSVTSWQPMARVMALSVLLMVTGTSGSVSLRLAYVLDDAAGVTLAASPTPLITRRMLRAGVAALAAAAWWTVALVIAEGRSAPGAVGPQLLQGATLLSIALATSALAIERAGQAAGGIAGATITLGLFASTFLPPHRWLPMPPQPDAPGATPRLFIALGLAVFVLVHQSRDPAGRSRSSRWWRVRLLR
jgi:hypothetical protein